MAKRGRKPGTLNQPKPKKIKLVDIINLPPTLSIREAAEKLGPSYHAINELAKAGKIRAFQSGRVHKVSTWDIIDNFNLFPKDFLKEILQQRWEDERKDRGAAAAS